MRPPRVVAARRVAANLLVTRFDGDVGKAEALRARIVGRGMVRRDAKGRAVVDLEVGRDKGPPPKRSPKKPKPVRSRRP